MEDPMLFKVAKREGFQVTVRPAEYRGTFHAHLVLLGATMADYEHHRYDSLTLHELIDVLLAHLDGISGY